MKKIKEENDNFKKLLNQLKLLSPTSKNKEIVYDKIINYNPTNLSLKGGSNGYHNSFKEDIIHKKYLSYKQKYINLKNKRKENI
jgi:hypothetical protein